MNGRTARRLRRSATEIWSSGGTRKWTCRQLYRRLKTNYKRYKSGKAMVFTPMEGPRS